MERAGYEAVHWLARPSFQQILVVADETGTCISVCLMCFDHDEMPDLMGMVPARLQRVACMNAQLDYLTSCI
jgi:hypothetical protein